METQDKTSQAGMLVGALTVGVILGLLFAPKTGEDLRDDIGDAFRRNRDKVRGLADKFGEKLPARLRNGVKDVAAEALRAANDMASEGGKI